MASKRLGEILLAARPPVVAGGPVGGLTPEVIEQALQTQTAEGGRIGEILVKMRAVTEEDVLQALGRQLGIAYRGDVKADEIDVELTTHVPIGFAKQHRMLVMRKDGDVFTVATADPLDVGALDDLRSLLAGEVQPLLCPTQRILEIINEVYGRKHDKGELGEGESEDEMGEGEELVDILEITDEAPIIRWVNSLLFNAVKERASDIHIEPGEKEVMVRYRIDGVLYETRRAPRQFMPAIISRVKIMAGLNIAEKRLPQDGRIRRKIAGKDIDMRVATVPTVKQGERLTIRLLDRESVLHDLADIGFGDDHLRKIDDLIHRPHGILLVTGPTGSGKTTTLYACLAKINSPDLNILTIEDPVEYQLDGISQTAVNDKIELTFAAGLRSFLRHDPDVIMVGEIRDLPTAEIAIQASLTGHLVLSTIHTNDAAGAITRLVDLGVQPFLVASSLMGLLAQRLVRKICAECREVYKPTQEDLLSIGIDPGDFASGRARRVHFKGDEEKLPPAGMLFRAKDAGCPACLGAGYKGRTAIYELLIIDETMRQLAIKNADAQTMKTAAVSAGMRTLREDGAQKVLAGMTTTAEVLMITTQDSS
ncbi:MAG: ral secretion pathway protein [Myxococcales bacterium]|jgi:general secretion pathway protein E|nr:ral secretion pathway protein [Myxococcales bacterium]